MTSINFLAADISLIYIAGYSSTPQMASVLFKTYYSLDQVSNPMLTFTNLSVSSLVVLQNPFTYSLDSTPILSYTAYSGLANFDSGTEVIKFSVNN